MTTKLSNFTFENGRTVQIRRVSPFLINKVRRWLDAEKPKPEMQDVGDGEFEPNYSHPDYLAAVEAHEERVQEAATEFIIKRGVVVTLDESEKADVQALRDEMRETFKQELEPDDRYVFIVYLMLGGETDRLINAITGLGQPTDDAVAAEKETFPSQS